MLCLASPSVRVRMGDRRCMLKTLNLYRTVRIELHTADRLAVQSFPQWPALPEARLLDALPEDLPKQQAHLGRVPEDVLYQTLELLLVQEHRVQTFTVLLISFAIVFSSNRKRGPLMSRMAFWTLSQFGSITFLKVFDCNDCALQILIADEWRPVLVSSPDRCFRLPRSIKNIFEVVL